MPAPQAHRRRASPTATGRVRSRRSRRRATSPRVVHIASRRHRRRTCCRRPRRTVTHCASTDRRARRSSRARHRCSPATPARVRRRRPVRRGCASRAPTHTCGHTDRSRESPRQPAHPRQQVQLVLQIVDGAETGVQRGVAHRDSWYPSSGARDVDHRTSRRHHQHTVDLDEGWWSGVGDQPRARCGACARRAPAVCDRHPRGVQPQTGKPSTAAADESASARVCLADRTS